jgi:integrase
MASIRKRTNTQGETRFHVQVRLKGYPAQTASFERLTDARKWAQQTESAIQEGRHFKTAEAKKHTLSEAIDRYFKDVLAHRKNPVNQVTYLTWWKEAIGEYRLADVTPSLLVEQRSKLVGSKNKFGRTVGTTTANRYVQSLGHVLNTAMNEWQWISENPINKIKKYKEPRGRVRFLSDEEREALLEACRHSDNPHLYLIVVLALSTGARKMEIVSLKWQDVDLKRGLIILQETKNDERRVIPLQGLALSLMHKHAEVKTLGCDYVFPSKKVTKDRLGKFVYQPIDIRTAWENALKNAAIHDFRFHDLRHSAASYLAMNGATLAEIAEVLGHRTLSMVKRYSHFTEAHTSEVVAKMNERIFGDG